MNMRVVSQSFGTGRLDPFEGESNTCKSNLQGLNYFKIVKEAKIGISSSSTHLSQQGRITSHYSMMKYNEKLSWDSLPKFTRKF